MFNFNPVEVKSAARNNKAFVLSARFWTATVAFRMGDEGYLLEMKEGEIADFRRDDAVADADITIKGTPGSWAKLLETVPPAGFQDPLFAAGKSDFEVLGDRITAVGPYYHAVQEFIDVLRELKSGVRPLELIPRVDRDLDSAVGRYVYVDIEGVQYRIYYEQAGSGKIPLLLQHTAGADSRQWRHVLEDPDYQKHYTMIAYDLPYHGRSLPPTSQKWWDTQYRLTRSFLMELLLAISKKLALDRPVFLGCSIGGMLAPDVAFYHPTEFRAVIGLNGGLGWGKKDVPPAAISAWEAWSNPRVGPQWTMGLIRSNLASTSPEPYRRETTWIYSQGAPTVNEGDIYYYAYDHDLTAEQAAQIDTSVVAVYLLTGSYDGLAFADGSKRLADAIPGSHFEIVQGVGHFGPAEDPDGIKPQLLRVLEEIASKPSS